MTQDNNLKEYNSQRELHGYAVLVDPEVLKKRLKDKTLDNIISRAKETIEIAIRSALDLEDD